MNLTLFSYFFIFIFIILDLNERVWHDNMCDSHTQVTKHDNYHKMIIYFSHTIIWYKEEYRKL